MAAQYVKHRGRQYNNFVTTDSLEGQAYNSYLRRANDYWRTHPNDRPPVLTFNAFKKKYNRMFKGDRYYHPEVKREFLDPGMARESGMSKQYTALQEAGGLSPDTAYSEYIKTAKWVGPNTVLYNGRLLSAPSP